MDEAGERGKEEDRQAKKTGKRRLGSGSGDQAGEVEGQTDTEQEGRKEAVCRGGGGMVS